MAQDVSERAARLVKDALVWDAHAGFMADPGADLKNMAIWRDANVDFLSVNVGFDYMPWEKTVETIAVFRHWIRAHADDYALVRNVGDINAAKRAGQMAIAFDLEGMNALNGRIEMIEFYRDLGVRQMLFAYNRSNLFGGGCHDEDDTGLTELGREAIKEMNRVGIVVDVTHCSYRTSMEAIELSSEPVVFSHSNPRKVWDHERNIWDDQIKACAATGGVIGAAGVDLFLGGPNDLTGERLAEHVDYLIECAGPRHVGLGLDYAFPVDCEWTNEVVRNNPQLWPAKQYPRTAAFVPPTELVKMTAALLRKGHDEQTIRGVLGENFMRVASHVWT